MPQDTELRNLRSSFMGNFVRALILNSYTPTEEEIQKITAKKTKPKEEKMIASPKISSNIQQRPLPPRRMPLRMPPPKIPMRSHLQPLHTPSVHELPPMPVPPSKKGSRAPQAGDTINLGKVTQLLIDPSVMSVECPGPGKNLLVNRSGAIQTASLILTKEEIDSLMEEISDKTRIPIMPGLFKAAFQDLMITAVVSDFVGSRFMIHKQTPFSRY
jgi:hypothetical protein